MRLCETSTQLPCKEMKVNMGSVHCSKKKFPQRMDYCYKQFYLVTGFSFVLILFNVTLMSLNV